MSADPYAAPATPLPEVPAGSLLGAIAALAAVAVAGLLVLLILVQPRTALLHVPELGGALCLLVAGLRRFAQRARGQASCYGLAAVFITAVFGLYARGVLEACAIACVLAALLAARGARRLACPNAQARLPLLTSLVFGAAGWALATLQIWLTPIEAPLAALLGLNRFGISLLLMPLWGFGAGAIAAAGLRGQCRGRLPWQWLVFVVGGVAYLQATMAANEYQLPGTYAPLTLDHAMFLTMPFALGAAVSLGWGRWRTLTAPLS